MKADLHVHSYYSGYASHLGFLRARDCYSDPFDIYRVAKLRGMDLVSITDHDSIDGCLKFLDRCPDAPDFIMGEEIECTFPHGHGSIRREDLKVHVGVLGITERMHREIQPLRGNVFDAVAYLGQQDVFFAVNHLFFFFDGDLALERYVFEILSIFGAAETRNGSMLQAHNELIEQLFGGWSAFPPVARVGGSDAHTLTRIGRTYTEAPGRNREEFLANLKAGLGQVRGDHGSTWCVAGDIYTVITQYWSGLLGLRRDDLSWFRRLLGIAFSVPSLPFQFIPGMIAVAQKLNERRRIERYRRSLMSGPRVTFDEAVSDVATAVCAWDRTD
jgi:predicted metal-dependent phosphoesterase TrpH